jgi:hypothetical protein
MPSYRVTLTMGAVRAGVDPGAILPSAASAARELTTVEASDIAVVAGQARIIVRYMAEDADVALQFGEHVARSVQQLAAVAGYSVTERVGNRWQGVRA